MLFLTFFFSLFVNFGFNSQFMGSWIEPGSGVQTEFKPLDLQGSPSYFLIFFHLAPSMGFFRLQKRNQSLSLHSPPPSPVIILPSSLLFPPTLHFQEALPLLDSQMFLCLSTLFRIPHHLDVISGVLEPLRSHTIAILSQSIFSTGFITP